MCKVLKPIDDVVVSVQVMAYLSYHIRLSNAVEDVHDNSIFGMLFCLFAGPATELNETGD